MRTVTFVLALNRRAYVNSRPYMETYRCCTEARTCVFGNCSRPCFPERSRPSQRLRNLDLAQSLLHLHITAWLGRIRM